MILPRLAIKNAQFVVTIAILLVLVGIVSYFNMPRSEDPQFDLPVTLVEVIYPGASPLDIESLIIEPLEEEFSDIENIKKIESQIKNGGVRIDITFLYGTNGEAAFNKVKRAVSSVESNFPSGVQEVFVLKATPTSVAIMQLALWSEPTNYKDMEQQAKQLKKRIEAISGVRKSDIWGYPQPIVAVNLNLPVLRHYGLSVTDVNAALRGRGKNITPGFVDTNTRRFNVKASGNFKEIDEIANTIILSNNDFVLRLKDVATVEFEEVEPNYLAYYDNKPVIFITVEQREHTNIFDLTKQVESEIEMFKRTLSKNMHIDVLFKQSSSVDTRVNGFFNNLWQGLIVVGIMSLLFLGTREALVVIVSIPLSFLVAIGVLDFVGFGLQQMSIVGLIIALGLLVDDAIVVTESIHREKKNNSAMDIAAAEGTSKVGWASTSGTITTMLAFLPMLLLASDTGDFIRSMPVTVILVLAASLLIALTLTPLVASKFFTNKPSKIRSLQHYVNIFAHTSYISALKKLMQVKWLAFFIAVISLIAMFSLFGKVGLSLFPKAEKPMILLDIETPPNSSLSYTNQVMQEMSEIIEKHDLVEKIVLNVGNSNPRIYYNEIPKRGVTHFGQILVVLKEFDEKKVEQIVAKLRAEFKQWNQAKVAVKEFTQGPVTDQPIAIRLVSNSLDELEKVANDLTRRMSTFDGIINIDNPIGIANTEISLEIDYEKAGLANIDINKLDITIQTILSGTVIGQFNDINGEDYPVMVRQKKTDIESLNDIHITNQLGQAIPLVQIAKLQLQKGPSEFFHFQKLRMAKVSADVENGYSVNELTAELVKYLEQYDMPSDMYFVLGGEEETRQESFAGLTQIMLITAIGIFAVLVLQFKSFIQPMIIFSSIPFAIAGSVVGLYLCGLSFSMMAFIGLISLFGIVVNNAIILIDTTNRNLLEQQTKLQAVLNASSTRFTPILLTTLTTIGGLLPLTIYGGGLWQPLGVVIISGLCFSAISSFLLVPILTLVMTKKSV